MDYQSGAVSPVGSLSDGWSIIKDNYWMYVLMIFVTFVILIAVAIVLALINNVITFAIAAGMGAMKPGNPGEVSATTFAPSIISMVISLFTNILVIALSGALFSGIYTAMSRTHSTGRVEFGDLFSGFSKISACLVVAVVMSIIQFIIGVLQLAGFFAIGAGAIGFDKILSGGVAGGNVDPALFSGLIGGFLLVFGVSLIAQLIISALTAFVYPLIGDRNLSGGQALAESAKAGLGNIVWLILMFIVMGLIAIVAAIPCGLGLPFVAPILFAGVYAAYVSVFGRPAQQQNYNPPPPPNFGGQQPPRY